MANGRVILVTGANRGIRFSIIQALGTHFETKHHTLLLGCRELAKGDEAVEELRQLGIIPNIKRLGIDVTLDESSLELSPGLVSSMDGWTSWSTTLALLRFHQR
jgi:NAD(P)-dependent dehydrogenase (short-subunit alcohol dehydrogenase family)